MRNDNSRMQLGRSDGFTVIELMIVVAIIGVLAAIALPAFDDMVKNNRRTTVVNELLANLMLARAEAAKTGRQAALCGFDVANNRCSASLTWSSGWIVFADDNRNNASDATDNDGDFDAGEFMLRRYDVDYPDISVRITTGPTTGVIALRPFNSASTEAQITICDKRGARKSRAVETSANGRARVVTNNVEDPTNGVALTCP